MIRKIAGAVAAGGGRGQLVGRVARLRRPLRHRSPRDGGLMNIQDLRRIARGYIRSQFTGGATFGRHPQVSGKVSFHIQGKAVFGERLMIFSGLAKANTPWPAMQFSQSVTVPS